jgi:hypothetical protein
MKLNELASKNKLPEKSFFPNLQIVINKTEEINAK